MTTTKISGILIEIDLRIFQIKPSQYSFPFYEFQKKFYQETGGQLNGITAGQFITSRRPELGGVK